MASNKVIVYGDLSWGKKEEMEGYLAKRKLKMAFSPFFDREEKDASYPELQKALFFAQKLECEVLFVSIRKEIKDIRFLNLLEESDAEFRCLDFPWLQRENIPLMKELLRYEKTE